MSLPGMSMIVASRTLRDITAAAALNLNGASTCVANYYCPYRTSYESITTTATFLLKTTKSNKISKKKGKISISWK
jgi:uncharacterized membrane protein